MDFPYALTLSLSKCERSPFDKLRVSAVVELQINQ
jgi:hypothetical protein